MIKKIIILATLIAVIFIAILFKNNNEHQPKNIINQNKNSTSTQIIPLNTSTEPELPFGQITKADRIKHIEWSYQNKKPYPQDSLIKEGPKEYVVTYYQPNTMNDSVLNNEKEGGVLLFKIIDNKPELIWENNDTSGIHASVWFEDVTSDNQNELLVLWKSDHTEVLRIYSTFNEEFELISPLVQPWKNVKDYPSDSFYSPLYSDDYHPIQLDDLDGDKIPEIWFPTTMNKDLSFGEKRHVAYKWDGGKYFIWKEQKEVFIEGRYNP